MSVTAEEIEDQARQTIQTQQAEQQAETVAKMRILNGVKVGMQFLTDETIVAPIRYSDGIVDLKWLLRSILSGEFSVHTQLPVRAAAKPRLPRPPVQMPPQMPSGGAKTSTDNSGAN